MKIGIIGLGYLGSAIYESMSKHYEILTYDINKVSNCDSIADIVNGKMSKNSKQYTTEIGKGGNREVISEVESVLVNNIDNTAVRGYEVFKQDVTLTTAGNYRAFVGIKLPMGPTNKMYNFTPEEAMDAHQLKGGSPAQEAWEIMNIGVNDEGSNIQ